MPSLQALPIKGVKTTPQSLPSSRQSFRSITALSNCMLMSKTIGEVACSMFSGIIPDHLTLPPPRAGSDEVEGMATLLLLCLLGQEVREELVCRAPLVTTMSIGLVIDDIGSGQNCPIWPCNWSYKAASPLRSA